MHEIDLLTYQTTELFNADVQPDEIEQLENERIILMNSEKILLCLMIRENFLTEMKEPQAVLRLLKVR